MIYLSHPHKLQSELLILKTTFGLFLAKKDTIGTTLILMPTTGDVQNA